MARLVRAEHGVPHTKFTDNPDGGFTASFRTVGLITILAFPLFGLIFLVGLFLIWSSTTHSPSAGLGFQCLLVVAIYIAWFFFRPKNKVIVTPEFVTVNNKKMYRNEFGGFNLHTSQQIKMGEHIPEMTGHTLGYTLGSRNFPFGGLWISTHQAQEVASALNRELKRVPLASDQEHISPEDLILDRPQGF